MPKRTNDFQELVSLVQKALADKGAVVTDSAMVCGSDSQEEREIDVLIETKAGPYQIRIAVEAKDEGRKMDMTKFESITGKYLVEGGVKVNKIVVITHRGFAKTVIKRAKKLGIELMTLRDAKKADWHSIYPQQIRFQMAPHICGIEITPKIEGRDCQEIMREGRVVCSHGTDKGNCSQYAMQELEKIVKHKHPNLFDLLKKKAAESGGQAMANIEFVPDHEHSVRYKDQAFLIQRFKFGVHLVDDRAALEFRLCELDSNSGETRHIPFMEAVVGGKRLRIVMPDGARSEKIVVRIDSASS